MELYNSFVEATGILYTRVLTGRFFFLDLWSINHMWSGFMLYLIATALHIKRPLLIILICQIGYEIFEIALTYLACNIFIPEIIKDQFTDIIIGFAGSFVGLILVSNYKLLIVRHSVSADRIFLFFISMSFAFLWLVFSRSSICSEDSLVTLKNLSIFFIWLVQAYITIVVFRKYGLFKRIKPWLIYVLIFGASTYLNFLVVSFSDSSAMLKKVDFFNWIYTIGIKMILFPFLPVLLPSAHLAFVKLVEKSAAGFSPDTVIPNGK